MVTEPESASAVWSSLRIDGVIVTAVAFVLLQVSVAVWPAATTAGVIVNVMVGAAFCGTTVTVSGTARETEFVFCVADEGRGVPEEKLETIFERFSQVDSSDSRDKGGSGLGLAICQSIVTAHGGRIWVEKNDPTGSRFQFTIPLADEEGQHAA